MSRVLAGALRVSALASLVVTAAFVSGSASAQDGPVLLTGLLPLGTAADAAPNAQLQLAANPPSDATVPQAAPASAGGVSLDVDVIARELDVARQQIEPSLGASVYNFGRQAIATQPQGDNQPLNRLLLQAPGVAQDLLRAASRPRRPCQPAISSQRRYPAGRDQRLRPGVADPARSIRFVDNRRAPGGVRIADCRDHRHPDQDRHTRSRWRVHPLRRPAIDI